MSALFNKVLYTKWMRAARLKTAPRWLILLADLIIVASSYTLVSLPDVITGTSVGHPLVFFGNMGIMLLVYFLVTYLSRSYTHIIRLSAIEDLYRQFLVTLIATVILLVINIVSILVTPSHNELMRFWTIIVTGVISFAFLVMERLVVKQLYSMMMHSEFGRKPVLVLGTSLNSLILANALKNEIGGKFRPVGLLSTGNNKQGKHTINGFEVYQYDPDTVANIFVGNGIYALIFGSDHVELMRNGFADQFINNNIRLLLINKVQEFEPEGDDDSHNDNISTHVKEVQIEDLLGRDPIVLNNMLVRNHIKGSCVLITGACGSIGSEIVRQVAAYKASKIVLVDQAETPMHDMALEMKQKFPDIDIVLYMGDIQNRDRMERAFASYRPKYVFHAAAYKHVPMMEKNPTEAVLTNVMGTRNIADLALKYGVYKFVMISTDKAVNPSNVMGCTKRLAEIYTQSLFFSAQHQGKNTQFITTRFGNVLGSNGSVIPLFRKQIAEGGPVTVTDKHIIRYFMTIPEACSLVLDAGCMGHGGEIYIFDMGKPVKIYDLATRMISLAGLKPGIDIKIEEIGLRPGEKLYEELLNDKEKTIKTDNEKIMIAKVRTYDFKTVLNNIQNIIGYASQGNTHDMIMAMKEFVPEFKSMNSVYEKIDKEIAQGNAPSVTSVPETEMYY